MTRNPIVQGYVDRRVAAVEGRAPFDAALRSEDRRETSELEALADAVFASPDPAAAMQEYEAAVDAAEDEVVDAVWAEQDAIVAEMAAESGSGFTRADVRASAWALLVLAGALSLAVLWGTA